MNCPTCGYNNKADATNCAACGTLLSKANPGILTGNTDSGEASSGTYHPHLAKGIRLQNGNYAVGEVLGQGGFGITYKGGDLTLRRYVAIKEFFPQGCARQGNTVAPAGTLSAADYAGVKAKFIEEARTLARFNDPGIVRVFGVFEENNTAYMVMEFLEGQTLSHLITGATAQNKTLDETLVIEIANKVGHALSVVHHAGLIHRDIKPDNICQTKDGRIVLIDFGTARSFASGKTVQQTTMLTPGYAPLEQYGQQARFGAYTDLYALAATLYHCLTGQVPPQATDRAAGVELKAPNLLNPRVSTAVSNALVWAMQVKATDRPQTVAQFLDALKNANPLKPAPQPNTNQSGATGGWGAQATQNPTIVVPQATNSTENWYHAIGGNQTGPIEGSVLQNLIKTRIIKADTLIWREGMDSWITAGQSEWASEITGASNTPDYTTGFPNRPKETAFDTFMMSIPGYVWQIFWSIVLAFIVGRTTLAIVRYQNGSRDFGDGLAARVLATSSASTLSETKLQLGEGVLDDQTLIRKHDDYVGTVRYKDGDAGEIKLDVTSRDWLYRPEGFKFNFVPTNFGYVMQGEIASDIAKKFMDNGMDTAVRGLNLQRNSRNYYSGSFSLYGNQTKKTVFGGNVSVTVTEFDDEGKPSSWLYELS